MPIWAARSRGSSSCGRWIDLFPAAQLSKHEPNGGAHGYTHRRIERPSHRGTEEERDSAVDITQDEDDRPSHCRHRDDEPASAKQAGNGTENQQRRYQALDDTTQNRADIIAASGFAE